jgi:hypothetical protein
VVKKAVIKKALAKKGYENLKESDCVNYRTVEKIFDTPEQRIAVRMANIDI